MITCTYVYVIFISQLNYYDEQIEFFPIHPFRQFRYYIMDYHDILIILEL